MDDRHASTMRAVDRDPPRDEALDRRAVVRAGAGVAIGVSIAGFLGGGASGGAGAGPAAPAASGRRTTDDLVSKWSKKPGATPPAPASSTTAWRAAPVQRRSAWAGGVVVPRFMVQMQPVTQITLHHDGMSRFEATDERQVAARLELIRRAHRNRNFGDIGYHYLVDPAGRVWEGRPLTWQGAHVARQNQGNLGICCLGNFEKQSPTEAQLLAVEAFAMSQMRRFNVPVARVFTHRELAPTACPGRNLQPRLLAMRRSGGALAQV